MKATAQVDGGVCGFQTSVTVSSEDIQHCAFDIQTDCETIQQLAGRLAQEGSVDAFQEINPAAESVVITAVRATLKGCCAGCAVPVGIFKAMQVAAGVALPKDIAIAISKGE